MTKEIKILKLLWVYYIKTMETYGFNSKKYTTLEYSSVGKTKQNRSMFLSNYAISGKKKSTFIKNKEVNKPD